MFFNSLVNAFYFKGDSLTTSGATNLAKIDDDGVAITDGRLHTIKTLVKRNPAT
jgi:hypothetical protein